MARETIANLTNVTNNLPLVAQQISDTLPQFVDEVVWPLCLTIHQCVRHAFAQIVDVLPEVLPTPSQDLPT